MPLRPSCRGCAHCALPQGGGGGWCRLRQLAIHPELAGDLWCHHWTARAPRLPATGTAGGATGGHESPGRFRQLSLEMLLPQLLD
ncbi:hypothetical protein [Cyanobium sp. CH-040]|uniref:hypothetical protein n=1 Tax=Cyanobium sp. CH-040 TaxID=2823708 RepID=UPI0020CC3A67|nr:hypothetical protein [Cyanobium sp. CH-040]MCP9928223.1 hypothetical protein [Cyanobium sp. CH-040]